MLTGKVKEKYDKFVKNEEESEINNIRFFFNSEKIFLGNLLGLSNRPDEYKPFVTSSTHGIVYGSEEWFDSEEEGLNYAIEKANELYNEVLNRPANIDLEKILKDAIDKNS